MIDIVKICKRHGNLTADECSKDGRRSFKCKKCIKEYRAKKKLKTNEYYKGQDREIDDLKWAKINDVFKFMNPKSGIK